MKAIVNKKRISIDEHRLKELASLDISVVNTNEQDILGQIWKKAGGGRVELNFLRISSFKHSNSAIQKEVALTLAHETRHLLQPDKKWGLFKTLGQRMSPFSSFLIIIVAVMMWLIKAPFNLNGVLDWILNANVVAIFGVGAAGPIFYYFFDKEEKDARKFAKEAIKDKEWLELVRVEDIKE